MCNDFDINISKNKIFAAFKFSSVNNQPLDFKQFQECLINLNSSLQIAKTEEIQNRLRQIQLILSHGKDHKPKLLPNIVGLVKNMA